jgi:hypothetical protein
MSDDGLLRGRDQIDLALASVRSGELSRGADAGQVNRLTVG